MTPGLAVVVFAALLTDRYGQLRTITDEVGAPQVSRFACFNRASVNKKTAAAF